MEKLLLSNFYLTQNKPNPVKDTTKIEYCLPIKSRVVITLYSPDNKKVKKILSKKQEAGVYEVNLVKEDLLEEYYYYEFNVYRISLGFRKLYTDMKRMMILKEKVE